MESTYYKDLVTDEELQRVMDDNPAIFGTVTGREWLMRGTVSARRGYESGSGVTGLLVMFGLVNKGPGTRNKRLTKKGLLYALSVSEERREEATDTVQKLYEFAVRIQDSTGQGVSIKTEREARAVLIAAGKIKDQ